MKRTLIAAAVLSVAGLAQAHSSDPYLYNGTEVAESVWVTGFFGIYGCVAVDNSAGAVVNNTQNVNLSGAKMSPTAQTYYKGKLTTTTDVTSWVNNKTGSGSKYSDSSWTKTSSSYTNNSSEKTGSNSWSVGAVAEGGYGYSTQAATSHTAYVGGSINATGSLNASGNEGTSYNYTNSNTKGVTGTWFPPSITAYNYGQGDQNKAGYLNAGFTLSGSALATEGDGQTWASSGSGSGYIWGSAYGSSASDTKSGWTSSKYSTSSSSSSSSSDWGYTSDNSGEKGSVRVHGSVTEYINTQTAGTSTASLGDGALGGATGNVGVNIASGIDNAQSNNASLASIDVGKTFGNAQVFSSQGSSGSGTIDNFNLAATVGDNALSGAKGNVGVNVASGLGNAQNNSLALVSSTPSSASGGALVATDDSSQSAGASIGGSFNGTASLGNGALSGATGNIGVNIAAGGGNLQHNGLAVASITKQ